MELGGQCLAALPPGKSPSTHCMAHWVALGASTEGWKISPLLGSEPQTTKHIMSCYTKYAIAATRYVFQMYLECAESQNRKTEKLNHRNTMYGKQGFSTPTKGDTPTLQAMKMQIRNSGLYLYSDGIVTSCNIRHQSNRRRC
jgi:hypothetical protein